MRKRTIALIAILTALLAACTEKTDYNTLLVRADSLMNLHPDSALHMLESISTDSLSTKADRAYHALLLTQARDKNYMVQTDDSLIQVAVRYYDTHEDALLQARAYYYWGCVYRDMKKAEEAVTSFLTANILAKKTKNIRLQSLICNNIGYLYYAQDLNEQADSIYREAEQMAVLLKDSLLQAEALSQQGMIRMEKGKSFYPKAEKLMLQALYMAKMTNNKTLNRTILSALSTLYYRMENGKKAVEFAKQNFALQEDTTFCYNAFYILGNAYYENRQYDSASFYLNKALPDKSHAIKAGVYKLLSDIAKASGDFKTSLDLERTGSIYTDSLRNNRNRQAYSVIDAEKSAQIAHQQKKHDSVISKYNGLLLSVVAAAFLALYMLKRYRRRTFLLEEEKDRLKEVQTAMQQQNAKLEEEQRQKENRIAYLERELEQLHYDAAQKKQLRNELEALNHERVLLLTSTQKYSDVKTKMKQIIQDYKYHDSSELHMEKEDWLQLIAETDRRWNQITLRLCADCKLLQEEIHLCCLYLTDLPVSYFGCLLGCKRDTVYKKANRIVEKRMGFPHGSTSLQKVLKELCVKTN